VVRLPGQLRRLHRPCHRSQPAGVQRTAPPGTGNRHDLREAILRAMPDTEYTAARRMVWAWWQHDHPAPEDKLP